MTIYKSVVLLKQFCDANENKPFVSHKKFWKEFEQYVISRHKDYTSIYARLESASNKELIVINSNLSTYGSYFYHSAKFADYLIDKEKRNSKIITILITGGFTILGSIIGGVFGIFG